MALGLAVTLDAPRLAALITVSGLPAGTKSLSIARVGPSGTIAGVRGASPVAAQPPSNFITHDFEVPLGVNLQYGVTCYDASGNSLGSVSVPFTIAYTSCKGWLVDIARPLNSREVEIVSMVELDYLLPSGVHRVLNRRAPVVTALPAWTPTSELIVLTDTLDLRDDLRNLLGSGYPFLLRTAPDEGVGNAYFALTQFVEARFLTLGRAPQRQFRISCVQVERPDPSVFTPTAPNTYANVKSAFATYAALKAGVANYDALAYTYPTGTSPVSPWLPVDV